MAITKELIDGLIVTIQNLYLADDIPWMVGYSGGKDSTAAVQLVWMALEKLPKKDRKKPIHIMNTDTLVESPVVSKWVEKSLESMRIEAEKIDLPIIPERLTPDYNNTFWVNLIGRGYPFPRMKYRWCTDRLKIQPVNNFIKNKIAEHGEIILVLGTRKQESSRRNIPTGHGAAGYTMPLPEQDYMFETRGRMFQDIVVALGGRVAEELVIGDITTGASQDIKQATATARAMVTKFGFSEKLGPINYEQSEDEIFIGKDLAHTRQYGERIASVIDEEVKRIIDEAYAKARELITSRMDVLDRSAQLLIEKEKLTREEFEALF